MKVFASFLGQRMTTTLRIFFEETVGLLVDIEVVFESITGSHVFFEV